MVPSSSLLQAVAVTAELCGRTFSDAAAQVFVTDLMRFPEHQIMGALTRCRREVRGVLTVQDVISRLDDGRPGPEEAWARLPFDEDKTVVWTDEMSRAFGIIIPLLDEGDRVAARMAFKEAYTKEMGEARDAGKPVTWTVSLGHDKNGRAAALSEAVAAGRLTYEHAEQFCPGLPEPGSPAVPALTFNDLEQLVEDRKPGRKSSTIPAAVIAYRESLKAKV